MNYKALVEHGFESRVKELYKGIATVLPKGQVFAQSDGSLAVTEILARLEAYIQLGKAADTAEISARHARLQLLSATPAAYALTEQVKSLVIAFHGPTNPALVQFGIQPKRRRKLKAIEQAEAAIQRGNTRKIRKTLGPRERLKLKAPRVALSAAVGTKPEGK